MELVNAKSWLLALSRLDFFAIEPDFDQNEPENDQNELFHDADYLMKDSKINRDIW